MRLWTLPLHSSTAPPNLLSTDELQRAARFHSDLHRHRFIATRAALRLILGASLNTAPAALAFRYSPLGKPFLPHTTLRFNLSHSGDYALIAIADSIELGVDIELIEHRDDLASLAARFFAPPESAALAAANPDEHHALFFHLWTRKEAYIKALGDGLARPLHSFSVAAPHPDPAAVSFLPIPAPPGYATALALRRPPT